MNTGACGAYLQHSKEWEEHVSVRHDELASYERRNEVSVDRKRHHL